MKVDAAYTAKPYEAWRAADWPSTYQSPRHANVVAGGIATGQLPPCSLGVVTIASNVA